MKNNIVIALCKLSRQFADSALNQSNLVGKLSSISRDNNDNDIAPQTVNSGSGVPYRIRSEIHDMIKQLRIESWSNGNTSHDPDQVEWIPIDVDGGVNLDYKVDSIDMSVSDMITDLQQTEHFNDIVANVASMFTTTPNVSASIINDYITNSVGVNDPVVSQFRDYVLLNSPSGSVNQFSFLKMLEKIMQNGKNELQDGKLTLNNNAPSYIANAIGTIILSVLATIAQIVSAILTTVTGIIGAIASVIVNLGVSLIKSITSVVRTGIGVNANSSLNVFDAPICILSDNGHHDGDYQYGYNLSDDQALVVSRGSLTYYIWSGDHNGDSKGFNCNVFLTLDLHPERTCAWLVNKMNINVNGGFQTSGSVDFTTWDVDYITFPDSCYYTAEEILGLSSSSDEELLKSTAFNLSVLGLLLLVGDETIHNMSLQNMWGRFYSGGGSNLAHSEALYAALHALACYKENESLDAWMNSFGSDLSEQITDAVINICQYEAHRCSTRPDNMWLSSAYDDTISCLPINGQIYLSVLNNMFTYRDTLSFHMSAPVDTVSNSIPTDGMFSFQNVKWAHLVSAISIITGIMAAVVVATVVTKVKYKKWSVKKQLTEKSKLDLARGAYIDSDTGQIIGGQDEYNAFYKQVRKYNKWGRILGYGTYDPGNDWTNAPDTNIALSDIPTDSQSSNTLLKDLTDDGQINLSSIKGSGSGTISDIIRMIKG